MKEIECSTQAEFDLCAQAGNRAIVRSGYFEARLSAQVTAYGSSQVTAYDSSRVRAYGSSQVTAYGSSQVTACGSSQVTAYGSSQVTAYGSSRVTAYGSSQVRAYGSSQVTACGSSRVTAYGSSQVTAYDSSQVRAYDSSQVTAYDSSQVRACGNVFIRLLGALSIKASASVVIMAHVKEKVVEGGQVIWAATAETPEAWCALHGVEVKDGVAMLFKALNDDFTSPHGTSYAPGSIPTADDWDGGMRECGGGLHFSPSPAQAPSFHSDAKRFSACYVRLADMRSPQSDDDYPEKIKASGCCAPCVECDIHGNVFDAGY